jgi:hypothetical protein
MPDKRHLELFLLQYVPSPTANDSVNIGLVLLERSESARSVLDARFTSNWQPVRALDPDADIDLLHAVVRDICEQVKTGNPDQMLQRMDDSFSNAIQLSSCVECRSNNPEKDIETLVAKYLS